MSAGVEWSPVTRMRSGRACSTCGSSASTCSMTDTLRRKSPSSPAESVCFTCRYTKSDSASTSGSASISASIDGNGGSAFIPTSRASPRYIGYIAMAAAFNPNFSWKDGGGFQPAKPRSSTSFAAFSPARRSRAWRMNSFATAAVRAAASPSARGSASGAGTPVVCGSVSATSPERPSPRNTTTARCSFSARTVTSTPSIRTFSARTAATRFPSSEAMRPARRSVTRPSPSRVAKLMRAATSRSVRSSPAPSAESTPRPTFSAIGS